MKTNHTIKALLAALLLAAAPSETQAASLIADGDFDNLPVGTAPNVGTPAGHWSFYPGHPELAASQVSIAPVPAGGTGNALRFSFAANENPTSAIGLINHLARPVTAASGQILNVSFDIYVEPGAAGAVFFPGKDSDEYRSAQLTWDSAGTLGAWQCCYPNSTPTTIVSSYPRGVWQTVRLELDAAKTRYNLYWSEKGQPVSVTRSNLTFMHAPPFAYINMLVFYRAGDALYAAARSYVDNIRVTTDPVITPVNGDLAVGGATTLQLLNLQAGSTIQWQFNGTNIDTATNATLELSNVTTDHAGSYTAVVTTGGQSITTEASSVLVFSQLTLTTPPRSLEAFAGTTTGFSVAATGPLPLSYQWRFNGTDMPDKTNRFLTFSASEATAGDYTVVVSDANGSVISPTATLTVLAKPSFVQAPLAQSVVAGGSVTFSAQITGTPAPFTYQWRKGTTFANSTVLTAIQSSGKTAFLTLNNVQPADAGTYRLYLANPAAPALTSTSRNASFTLTVLPDTDGDGLPDEWELAHGLNPNDPSDALADADGDGLSNLVEYQSGTSATNAVSGLKMEAPTHANGQATVTFPAAANQTYTVEWCTNAAGGSWQKLVDVVAQAADRQATVTDTGATDSMRFYRVVTPRRP